MAEATAMSRPKLSANDVGALVFLAQQSGEVSALQIGEWLNPARSPRACAGAGSGIAWNLIREGLAERRLKRREFYVYRITSEGRAVLREAQRHVG